MAGRIFLVLLFGSWLAFALSFWIVSGREASNVAQMRGHFAAERLSHWLALTDTLHADQRNRLVQLAQKEGVELSLAPPPPAIGDIPSLHALMQGRLGSGIRLLEAHQGEEECD